MKDKIISFLKNKFNITLIAIQAVALICYFLSGVGNFFPVMFFALEGVFFIVWGIKILKKIKDSKYSSEIISQLPYSEEEKEKKRQQLQSVNKNNKFIGIMLIVLGIILIFSLFSSFN